MRYINFQHYIFTILLLLLASCSSDPESSPPTSSISGIVLDANNNAINNALVSTSPPTESVFTNSAGRYQISTASVASNSLDVTVEKLGYSPETRRVTVAADVPNAADFVIQRAINGLVSSVTTLEIPLGQTEASFVLSSTVADVNFSFLTDGSAFTVQPATGILGENQLQLITVSLIDTSSSTNLVTGQLIANADKGATGIQMNLRGRVTNPQVNLDPWLDVVDPSPSTPSPPSTPTTLVAEDFDSATSNPLADYGISVTATATELATANNDGVSGSALCATDSEFGSSWYWQLPTRFLGNLGSGAEMELSFNLRGSTNSQALDDPLVMLVGNNGTVLSHQATLPGAAWREYRIDMAAPSTWRVGGSSEPPTVAQLVGVLSNANEILILGDYTNSTSRNQGCIDAIALNRINPRSIVDTAINVGFDTGTDGWSVVDGSDEFGWQNAGGDPGGHLCFTDEEFRDTAYWAASSQILSSLASAYGRELSFRVKASSSDEQLFSQAPAVRLIGAGLALDSRRTTSPANHWKSVRMSLVPEQFAFTGTSESPTETEFRNLLANASGLYLLGNWDSNSLGVSCLDNVGLNVSLIVNTTSYEEPFSSDEASWSVAGSATDIVWESAGGAPRGHVCATDADFSDSWYFIAPATALAAIQSGAGAMTFETKTANENLDASPELLRITGNSESISYARSYSKTGLWVAHRVPFDSSAGWVYSGTTERVQEDAFTEILANISELGIRSDTDGLRESATACLDNVAIVN